MVTASASWVESRKQLSRWWRMAVTAAVAEKGLASLRTEQLLDLYHEVTEVYNAALMWEDKEIIERSKGLLRQLNEAFEKQNR